jgi:hypothetical protein
LEQAHDPMTLFVCMCWVVAGVWWAIFLAGLWIDCVVRASVPGYGTDAPARRVCQRCGRHTGVVWMCGFCGAHSHWACRGAGNHCVCYATRQLHAQMQRLSRRVPIGAPATESLGGG